MLCAFKTWSMYSKIHKKHSHHVRCSSYFWDALKEERHWIDKSCKVFSDFKSIKTLWDSWTVAGREPSSILTVPQFPSASQVIIIHVFLKIESLWEGKSESGLNSTMTLGGTPLSIISEQRIRWWAPSILGEIYRTLITCVSSHHSPVDLRPEKDREEGLLELRVRQLKLNYSLIYNQIQSTSPL